MQLQQRLKENGTTSLLAHSVLQYNGWVGESLCNRFRYPKIMGGCDKNMMQPKIMRWSALLCAAVFSLFLCGPVATAPAATTYYVDFEGGDDGASGTSPGQAFRHAPGDPQAGGAVAEVELQPGDTVIFRGGVVYRGRLVVSQSGEPGRLITIDGNTDGTFGEGRAILDGSEPITGWRRCTSPEDAGGNPDWDGIFYADIPGPVDWRNINLTAADRRMPVAQDPKPSDPFFQNRTVDFYSVDRRVASSFPGRIFFEEGSRGNRQTPLIGLLAGSPTVVEPIEGGAFSVELDESVTITAVGLQSMPQVHVREFEVLGDGERLLRAELPPDDSSLQRFDLPEPVTVRKLTYRLLSTQDGVTQRWTRLRRAAAFTPDGENVLGQPIHMIIEDEDVLTATDPHAYDGMTVGFHGGNNVVIYREVEKFDPGTHRLYIGFYGGRLYPQTRYALFNSARLIERPGEFSVTPLDGGDAWRVHLRPDRLEDGLPEGVGYAAQTQGIMLRDASHVVVRGLTVRRQGGDRASGIMVHGGDGVRIEDCEVTLVGGIGIQSLGAVELVVENCDVHHCSGRGIFHRNGRGISTLDCHLRRNGSTGLGHYNIDGGVCGGNVLYGHLGTHANGLTFYLGCRDMVIERNEVWGGNNSLTIQEAENIVIRNNILDGGGRSVPVGIWTATPFRNVRFLNNTIVNAPEDSNWEAGVFSNNRGPEDLVFRNNIIDGLSGNLPALYEHNLYTRWGPNQQDRELAEGERYEPDLERIFVDPANRDFRLRPDSPAVGAGLELEEVQDDFSGNARPHGQSPDMGAFQYRDEE